MVKTAVHRLCASAMITVAKLTVLHFFVSNCSLRGQIRTPANGGRIRLSYRTDRKGSRQAIDLTHTTVHFMEGRKRISFSGPPLSL
jgi:hypothetical protein